MPSGDASKVSDHDAVNPRETPSPPTVTRPRGPSGRAGSELPRLVASAAARSSSMPSSSDAARARDAPLGVLVHAHAVLAKGTSFAFWPSGLPRRYPPAVIGERRRQFPDRVPGANTPPIEAAASTDAPLAVAIDRQALHSVRLRREIISKSLRASRWFRSRVAKSSFIRCQIAEGLARSGVDGVRDVHLDGGDASGEAR